MGHRTISGVRVVTGALVALVAAAGLTACRTNVGNAATIDGQRVSETQVNDYVTDNAKPISGTQGGDSIAPRPFVVDVLIQEKLYRKVLGVSPSGAPSKAQLTTLQRQYLAGSTVKAAVEKLGAVGYTAAFNSKIIDVQVMGAVLSQEQQQGVDVTKLVSKITFPVSVNPRYGTWDSKQLRFDAGTSAGVPAYLKLQSASSSLP